MDTKTTVQSYEKYCCMPECGIYSGNKCGVSLFAVPKPDGMRQGAHLKDWPGEFYKVIFRYRHCPRFKQRVFAGKVYICSEHFDPSDVNKMNTTSCLKPGALPTRNLPTKSFDSLLCPNTGDVTEDDPALKDPMPSIDNIIKEWKRSAKVSDWRMYRVSTAAVHFTYYRDHQLHFSPSISLFITEKNGILQFSIAFDGLYAPSISTSLEFGSMTLKTFLTNLQEIKICSGYESTPYHSGWFSRSVWYRHGTVMLFRKRNNELEKELKKQGQTVSNSILDVIDIIGPSELLKYED